jgi:pantoate--beta-alanine ligase
MTNYIFRHFSELRQQILSWKAENKTIGFVPTMGALHQGHMSLVKRAFEECDRVIVSIFVNPKQFGPREDFQRYPRQEQQDIALLKENNCHAVYIPNIEEIYPEGFSTQISVKNVSEGACGATREGHFDGVALVVTKLLLQTFAEKAFFGEKDWQQLQVIRRLVLDLSIPVEIIGVPIFREKDGLAFSSRNAYLSDEERRIAPALYQELLKLSKEIPLLKDMKQAFEHSKNNLMKLGFSEVHYIELRDNESFKILDSYQKASHLLIAATLGKTRLIDNIKL